ncbi:Uncharacterised protein (plasmid) [Tsukamurella tyrosinosolvens]|uniref:Uncharacterized protein n=1 Tax=Tsukamurella tyrosinosolvens TaxID=57704 RepID=A0A1H4VF78_TSUTY|nr:hypothetical protein [Tsukamurella tyrosinosolvens]KXO90993.1 hypothetical protein AXK58_21420 [Tsukamurella tyrosinosolvens]SEC79647.1 hypothetical protein SAMN04489793_3209 [Tsukamurella tyrosinosolvens]VEH90556.1 Uncharacterised protein [Tsukamurella tyrosinosolvens]
MSARSIGLGTVHGYGWTAEVEVHSYTPHDPAAGKAGYFTVRYVKTGRRENFFIYGTDDGRNLEGDRLSIDEYF